MTDPQLIKVIKLDNDDRFVGHRELRDEGYWCDAYQFETTTGHHYEIWMDPDGAEKLVEL